MIHGHPFYQRTACHPGFSTEFICLMAFFIFNNGSVLGRAKPEWPKSRCTSSVAVLVAFIIAAFLIELQSILNPANMSDLFKRDFYPHRYREKRHFRCGDDNSILRT